MSRRSHSLHREGHLIAGTQTQAKIVNSFQKVLDRTSSLVDLCMRRPYKNERIRSAMCLLNEHSSLFFRNQIKAVGLAILGFGTGTWRLATLGFGGKHTLALATIRWPNPGLGFGTGIFFLGIASGKSTLDEASIFFSGLKSAPNPRLGFGSGIFFSGLKSGKSALGEAHGSRGMNRSKAMKRNLLNETAVTCKKAQDIS